MAALLAALLPALCLGGCGETRPVAAAPPGQDAQPPDVDLGTIASDQLVDRVLATCHGPLLGDMDRVHVRIRFGSEERIDAHADLPDHLRISGDRGALLLAGDAAFALGATPRAATAEEREWLGHVRALVDAASLGPLQRATGCERTGDRDYRLTQPDGSAVALRLRDRTLLPELVGGCAIRQHLRTPASWITQVIEHPVLGRAELFFENAGMTRNADFFAPPQLDGTAGPEPGPQQIGTSRPKNDTRIRIGGAGTKPTAPVVRETKATRWLVLEDPGDWPARHELYAPHYERLVAADQRIAGFPILVTIDAGPRLALPFRQRPTGPAATLPAGLEILELPAGRELEVYPGSGDLAARRAAGETALRAHLQQNDLEALGPIVCQPFVHLHEGPPDAARLADLTVRMSVRIR